MVFVLLLSAYSTKHKALRFTYVVACVQYPSFLRLNNSPLYIYATFCLSILYRTDVCVPPAGFQVHMLRPNFQ